MITLLIALWLVFGVFDYLLLKWMLIRDGFLWDNSDRLFTLFVTLGGPLAFIGLLSILIFTKIPDIDFPSKEWLGRKAKW